MKNSDQKLTHNQVVFLCNNLQCGQTLVVHNVGVDAKFDDVVDDL